MGIVNPYEHKEKYGNLTYQAREKLKAGKLDDEIEKEWQTLEHLHNKQFYKDTR